MLKHNYYCLLSFSLVVQAFYTREHVDGFVSTGCSSLKVLDGVESLQKP